MKVLTLLRYAALGDSYTAGTGATALTSWPAILTRRLNDKGLSVTLVGNLGRNGWTAQDAIDGELPHLKSLQPDFVTVLIGTNDWVQGLSTADFQRSFHKLLDGILTILKEGRRVIVLTNPDFSVTPRGRFYSDGRDITQGLIDFNSVILDECGRLDVMVIDLFTFSQKVQEHPSWISSDGLHPSAEGYAAWAEFLEPGMYRHLMTLRGDEYESKSAER